MTLLRILIASALLASIAGCQSPKVASSKWPTHECDSIPGVQDASYCYDETAVGASEVLWFLHGLEDSKDVWTKPTSIPSDYPSLIKAMPPMRIITISFGPGWLLSSYPGRTQKPAAATIEVFREKIEPYLKAKYALTSPYKLASHSMGGMNAAVLLEAMPEMWSKAVLINPMLIKESLDPFNKLSLCDSMPVLNPCTLIRFNYPTKESWQTYRPRPFEKMPPMLITACPSDVFGLYNGAEDYVIKARAKGNSVKFIEGDPQCTHWRWRVDKVIEFLKQ